MVDVVDYGDHRVLEDDEKIRTSVIFEFQECGHYQEEEDVSIRSSSLRLDTPVELVCRQCEGLRWVTGRTIKMDGKAFAI